jgi:UDP-arabinose 4-epimerase
MNRPDGPNVLVTGGAGYIGSHTCKLLAKEGYLPVAYDDLSLGHRSAVKWGPLVTGDIADSQVLTTTIRKHHIDSVIHFAGSAYVGESVNHPRKYFHNNLSKTIAMLGCLLDEGVNNIVLSSTCATYGVPQKSRIDENHPQQPVNPYGESKVAIERVLQWYGQAYGLKWIALRYFNAAGADPDGEIGESHDEETHLVPLAVRATYPDFDPLRIFGVDYPTKDGTAVRDFIHVSDLASAHIRALEYLARGCESRAFNLGSGVGHSVRDVVAAAERVTGRRVRTEEMPRRPGDPAELIADPTRAHQELQWRPQFSDLNNIVRTAWTWIERSQKKALSVASE